LIYLVHKVALEKIDKLKQTKKEANHKLRNLRQRIARLNDQPGFTVVDLSEIDVPEEIADEDMRAELALLQLNKAVEDERLRRLVYGAGKGRPKSPAFEFAARTILATGKSQPPPAFTFPST
jgi:hypothetical protein